MKVSLQMHASENFHLCRWGEQATPSNVGRQGARTRSGEQILKRNYQRKLIHIFSSYEITVAKK